jgi:hypothetical protein
MTKTREQIGWVYPPGTPRGLYDADAKTSRFAVGVGILVIVALVSLSWWLRNG